MKIELRHAGNIVASLEVPEAPSIKVAALATDIARAVLMEERENTMRFDVYVNSRHHAEFTLRKTIRTETYKLVSPN